MQLLLMKSVVNADLKMFVSADVEHIILFESMQHHVWTLEGAVAL